MSYLIDTNVISEVGKGTRCDPQVARWWKRVGEDDLYLSVLTLGEVRRGIEQLRSRDLGRASTLDSWLIEIEHSFVGRILPIDRAAADCWGRMSAVRSLPVIDALLAATAVAHGLTLATRNIRDLHGVGAKLLDPFRS